MNTLYVIVPKDLFLEYKDDDLDSYISDVISRYNKNKISSVEVPYSTLHELYTNIIMGSYDYADASNMTFEKFLTDYKISKCPYFIDDEMELFENFEITHDNPYFKYTPNYLESIFGFLKSKRKYSLGKNVMNVKEFIEIVSELPPNPIVIDHTQSIFHRYFGYRGDYIFDSYEDFVRYTKNHLAKYENDLIISINVF